jgi:hypothetical protein
MINELIRQERLAAAVPEPPVVAAAFPPPAPKPAAAASLDLTAAWELLHNPQQIKNQEDVDAALVDIGIYDVFDLEVILNDDEEQVKGLIKFLRPVGAAKFKRALGFL